MSQFNYRQHLINFTDEKIIGDREVTPKQIDNAYSNIMNSTMYSAMDFLRMIDNRLEELDKIARTGLGSENATEVMFIATLRKTPVFELLEKLDNEIVELAAQIAEQYADDPDLLQLLKLRRVINKM